MKQNKIKQKQIWGTILRLSENYKDLKRQSLGRKRPREQKSYYSILD